MKHPKQQKLSVKRYSSSRDDRISKAYAKIGVCLVNNKLVQLANNNFNVFDKGLTYLQRQQATQEIYHKCSKLNLDKINLHESKIQPRQSVRSASIGMRQNNYQYRVKPHQFDPKINLYLSQGKRKRVFERNNQCQHNIYLKNQFKRTQSARNNREQGPINIPILGQLKLFQKSKENQLDWTESRAISSKLNGIDPLQLKSQNTKQIQEKGRKKSKIIIFEKGIILRNKF